jgi:hypothetical protein
MGCGTAATGQAGRETLETIPQAAAAGLRRAADGATIERVVRERERGNEVFEATWHVGGLEREATVNAEGDLVDFEEEVESTQVPSRIRAAALAKLPNAQSIRFVKLQSGNYEVEASIDGREVDVTFTPEGRETKDEDELDEGDIDQRQSHD